MTPNYHHEIVELHQFFQDWFNGDIDPSETAFSRFSGVMAEDFTIITPTGIPTPREPLISMLQKAHATRQNIKIWIENIVLRHRIGGMLLVTYEEWQQIGDDKTGRLSSALFREDSNCLNGLEWLHVHETWLEQE